MPSLLPALIPLIVNQLCDLQRTEGTLGPGILGNILRGEEFTEVITGFLTIFVYPEHCCFKLGRLSLLWPLQIGFLTKKPDIESK